MKRSPSILVLILVIVILAVGLFVGRSTHQSPAMAEAEVAFDVAVAAPAYVVPAPAAETPAAAATRVHAAGMASEDGAVATVETSQDWVRMPGTRIAPSGSMRQR